MLQATCDCGLGLSLGGRGLLSVALLDVLLSPIVRGAA